MSYLDEIPTYRKRNYKKRAPRAKKAPTRGKIYGAAAGQLYKDVQLLKSMVNVEYKVQDTNVPLQNVGTVPIVTLFNALQLGNDYNNRNGRSVKWTSIYQRWTAQSVVTATLPHYVRYVLFWVKDSSATAPTPTQMFGSAAPDINAMMNLNVRKDFIILKDDVVECNPATGGKSSNFMKYYLKTNMHTIFNASSLGTIADIESGALYSFIWSDTNTAGEQPQLRCQSRLRYIDN